MKSSNSLFTPPTHEKLPLMFSKLKLTFKSEAIVALVKAQN